MLIRLLASLGLLVSVNAYADSTASFMGGEHVTIGDDIKIRLSLTDVPHNNVTFNMTNGASLSYGELLSLGDFYGVLGVPIATGKTLEEREARFKNVFDLVDIDPAAAPESAQLMDVLHNEVNYVQEAMSRGMSPKAAYEQISGDSIRQFNCITGGGCSPELWWTKLGRSSRLASSNYDHFGDNAVLAYEAGHRVAMNEAVTAYRTHDLTHLQRAYAMNALACHFLADRFATGHMRGPRVEMYEHVTPGDIGNVLMKFMHDEESTGLNVHNAAGDRWRAYGDGFYFEPNNAPHKQHVTNVMQQSADEIFSAFQSGKIIDNSKIPGMIPIPDEMNGVCKRDIAAMFIWDKNRQKILRRFDLDNPYACSWTSVWFGWSTLVKLAASKGMPVLAQVELAQSKYANEAMDAGLITDPNIVKFMKSDTILHR